MLNPTHKQEMRSALSNYVAWGWHVTPLESGKKAAFLKDWNSDQSTTIKTLDQIKELTEKNCNIGICLAWNNWATLDIDDLQWSLDYFAAKGIDLESYIYHDEAVLIESGTPNKAKIVFKLSDNRVTHRHDDEGKTRFEFRCGDKNGNTVQDALPPSIHPSGTQYRFSGGGIKGPNQQPQPMEMPVELLDIWDELNEAKRPQVQVADDGLSFDTVTLEQAKNALEIVSASSLTRQQWIRVAMALKSIEDSDDSFILFDLWSRKDKDRYDQDELIKQWNSVSGSGGVSGSTILYLAKEATKDLKIPLEGFPLPSPRTSLISITQSARHLWTLAKKHQVAFHRSGVPVEIFNGGLAVIGRERLITFVERIAEHEGQTLGTLKRKSDSFGWAEHRLQTSDASVMLADKTLISEMLDEIRMVSHTPVLTKDGSILRKGYHAKYQTLVLGGDVDDVDLKTAVSSLKSLIVDFKGERESDRSRMIAAFLTPAVKPTMIIDGHTPMFFYEANESQSGKGTYAEAVPLIYGEQAISIKQTGVGDNNNPIKQIDVAMVSGYNHITLDNWRGDMKLPVLESLITGQAGSHVTAKKYAPDVVVDPTAFNWATTSNGVKTSVDMFNRYCFISMRKQPTGHRWKHGDKQGFHNEIRDNQSFYLGCVFTVIREWINQGKQVTNDHGHAFVPWAGPMDWIVQNLFGMSRLTEGTMDRKHAHNPSLAFLREASLAVKKEGRLDDWLGPDALADVLVENAVKLSGNAKPLGEQYENQSIRRIEVSKKMVMIFEKKEKSIGNAGFNIRFKTEERGGGRAPKKLFQFKEVA